MRPSKTIENPRPTRFARLLYGLAGAGLLLAALPAGATSYVMMADANLADQAPVIVRAEVTAIEAGPAGETPATDYLVAVSEVLKGDVAGSTIVVRVPGGESADGRSMRIWGAPEMAIGEGVLLFLETGPDGEYRPLHLMLGVFHATETGNGRLALRDLSGAQALGPDGSAANGVDVARDLDKFGSWLGARAQGVHAAPDYVVAGAGAERQALEKYTLLTPSDGAPVRWFNGGSVWYAHASGQPGQSQGETAAMIGKAVAAWNEEPNSAIHLSFGGTTSASRGFGSSDGTNTVLFDDPNREVAGSYSCGQGGVVAMGGPYYYGSTRSYNGRNYHEAFEADIVTNDGAECFFRDNPRGAEEVLAHELGHTLGFGHSADRDAVMWASAHSDGRGIRLGGDDYAAAAMLYGDGTVYNAPPAPPAPPVAPAIKLTGAAKAAGKVQLTWRHTLKNLTQIQVEIKDENGDHRSTMTLPKGAKKATLAGLDARTTYRFRVLALRQGDLAGVSGELAVTTK